MDNPANLLRDSSAALRLAAKPSAADFRGDQAG